MNTENEKGGAPGKVSALSENFSDDNETVQHPSKKINGIAAPPAGYAFADTAEGQPKRLEPITMPPQDAEPEPLSELLELARRTMALYDWAHADEHTPKVAAVRVVLDQDRRDPKTIAASLGVSTELIRLRIRQARAVLAELRGEAVPATGAAKP